MVPEGISLYGTGLGFFRSAKKSPKEEVKMLRSIALITLLCLTGLIIKAEAYKLDFELVNYIPGASALNAVCYVPGTGASNLTNRYFAVGDEGLVYILKNDGRTIDRVFTLDPEYNLSGVSGFRFDSSTSVFVIVVGYKKDSTATGPKWKGAIWWSTNRGGNWTRVPDVNLPGLVTRSDLGVPFLDVKVVNRMNAWVSCGHGYVMRSEDGGVTWSLTPRKPVRPNYHGWFWGIWSPRPLEAWVCSDETTLVAHTTDGGETWNIHSPFAADSISYRDICGDSTRPGTIYLVASKGYLVKTRDNGASWSMSSPLEMEIPAEWLRGVFRHALPSPPFNPGDTLVWCVGTGGIIANDEEDEPLIWYSRRYDFNAIDGGCARSSTLDKFTYVAVGTNRTIMWIEVDKDPYEEFQKKERNRRQEELRVYDTPNDEGWSVYGDWDEYPGAERWYRLYILPGNDVNNHKLREVTDWGKKIGEFPLHMRNFTYDSILIGHYTTFTITTWEDDEETDIYDTDTFSIDNLPPRSVVTGLRGRYIRHLDAAIIYWDPYPVTSEANLGGYWVCPVIEGLDINIKPSGTSSKEFLY